jgi:hypothetical protein
MSRAEDCGRKGDVESGGSRRTAEGHGDDEDSDKNRNEIGYCWCC